MKNLNLFALIAITVAVIYGGAAAPAHAAKFHTARKLEGKLQSLSKSLEAVCEKAGEYNYELHCNVRRVQIDSKSSDEAWKNTAKQILMSRGDIQEVRLHSVSKKQLDYIGDATWEVISAAGFELEDDGDYSFAESLTETLREDVADESRVLMFAGKISNEHGMVQSYVLFIDTQTDEVLAFTGGKNANE
jgi:hypothetical protein